MSFNYNTGIPAAQNNPSNDQPNMLTNTDSINNWVQVDHIGFNDAVNSGKHKEVTLNGNHPPGTPSVGDSVVYTNPGTADATKPQLFWKTSTATTNFLLSGMRAWAFCNAAGVINSQKFNVTSVVVAAGVATVTLPAGVVNTTDYAVFVTATADIFTSYSVTSTTSFDITFSNLNPVFSFQVMQI